MLRELGSIRMTRDLLRATGVGKAINELRSKHADEAVTASAAAVLTRLGLGVGVGVGLGVG